MLHMPFRLCLRSKCALATFCQKLFYRSRPNASNITPKFNLPKKSKKVPKHRKIPLFESHSLELAPKLSKRPAQNFDYFLVIDFEATCDSPSNLAPQEIIEFPALKVSGKTFEVESTFHSYVRPVINPQLTSFCTELTGIIQGMLDSQPVFKDVFKNFLIWLEKENLLEPGVKFAFATSGDPDLDYLLPVQCELSRIDVPEFMKQWINVKRSFCEVSPYTWPDNLTAMVKLCGLEHVGELHSGLDDAMNIARVMANLADRGVVFNNNGFVKKTPEE